MPGRDLASVGATVGSRFPACRQSRAETRSYSLGFDRPRRCLRCGIALPVIDNGLPEIAGLSATQTALAFDFGLRHIGVAFGQSVTGTASPVATLSARRGVPRWEEIDELVQHWRPSVLLVGLPLNMDSTMSEMAALARRFADALAERYPLPVHLVDERLTSFEARGLSPDTEDRHAIAARLIAESWLSGGN